MNHKLKPKYIAFFVVLAVVATVTGLMLVKQNQQQPFSPKGSPALALVEPSAINSPTKDGLKDAVKVAETPKMFVGLGNATTNEAIVTIKPKPEAVPEFADAAITISLTKNGLIAKAFGKRFAQNQKLKFKSQNFIAKVKSFFEPKPVQAHVNYEDLKATLDNLDHESDNALISQPAPGVYYRQEVTELMYQDYIYIDHPKRLDFAKPYLEFVIENRNLTPIKQGEIWYFVKPEDKDKRTANGHIPAWAAAIPVSYVFDADGKMSKIEITIEGSRLIASIDPDFLANAKYPITIDPHVTSSGNTRTFDGGAACTGTETWNIAGNWSADTLPTTGDAVVFDATCNTAVTGDVIANNILSLSLNTGFTSTLTISADAISGQSWHMNTLTVNAGNLAFTGKTNTNDTNDAIPGNGINDGLGWTITAQDATVVSGTILHANGLGFSGGQGPGAGSSGGGSYGGKGGGNSGSPYGSVTSPLSLGSGGILSCCGNPGAGGGAVILNITGTLTVGGTISANGSNSTANGGGGGGSGGSVNITAGTLTGSGTISANGGNDTFGVGGGGGGGRIKVIVNGSRGGTAPTLSVTAGTGGTGAGAGTSSTEYREIGLRGGATLRGGVIFK